MSDTQVSGAARQLAAQRWGASKLVRMVQELELRAAELPDLERIRLLDALDLAGGGNVSRVEQRVLSSDRRWLSE
jgi:hypothetical protein